ncbi:hypothetical protein Y032_0067g121 [Ancylostoma ceylanicum]|uniref:Uncharacterized protein n=1 Tax=Ancylostoma ceylanicum TaxID=53326 RepID=A0A016TZ67_9BILA|nr:hypothetical protein Y032_0067g121 [Ancylostoma ceylanicum]
MKPFLLLIVLVMSLPVFSQYYGGYSPYGGYYPSWQRPFGGYGWGAYRHPITGAIDGALLGGLMGALEG